MEKEDDFVYCPQTSKPIYILNIYILNFKFSCCMVLSNWIFITTYMYRYDALGPVPAGLMGSFGRVHFGVFSTPCFAPAAVCLDLIYGYCCSNTMLTIFAYALFF